MSDENSGGEVKIKLVEVDASLEQLDSRDINLVNSENEQISDELREIIADRVEDAYIEEIADRIDASVSDGSLEPMPPSDGVDRFIKQKLGHVSDTTLNQYETKLEYVECFLTDVLELSNINDLTSRQADEYKQWRKCQSEEVDTLERKTLKDDIGLFKRFLTYMEKIDAVSSDVPEAVERVRPKRGEGVEKVKLDPERAADTLGYLMQFEYASTGHVVLLLLIKTGRRPCGLRALDLDDFDGDDMTLEFVDRPNTRLKERDAHEAEISLSEETTQVIRDYIQHNRSEVVDEHGREPLLAPGDGRISKSTIKEYAYRFTRPCVVGKDCPYDKDPDSCEAANDVKKASKCPGSRSPRPMRTGYITAKLNTEASAGSVAHRVGATEEVIREHYDHPTKKEERQRHQDDILNNNEGAGGYANGY